MLLFKKLDKRVKCKGQKKQNILSLIPLFISLALISSCGFTPMYAQTEENEAIVAKLTSVDIKPIQNIIGQEYVNALEDVLNPGRVSSSKDYIINVDVGKDTQPLAIEQDRTVTRYKVIVTAKYTLKEISSGKIISKGTLRGQADYDKVDSDYATYVSESDTTSRAIKELAQDTKIRIIAALLKN